MKELLELEGVEDFEETQAQKISKNRDEKTQKLDPKNPLPYRAIFRFSSFLRSSLVTRRILVLQFIHLIHASHFRIHASHAADQVDDRNP